MRTQSNIERNSDISKHVKTDKQWLELENKAKETPPSKYFMWLLEIQKQIGWGIKINESGKEIPLWREVDFYIGNRRIDKYELFESGKIDIKMLFNGEYRMTYVIRRQHGDE